MPKEKSKEAAKSSFLPQGAQYNNLLQELMTNPFKMNFNHFGSAKQLVIRQRFEYGIGGVLWDCEYILTQYLLMQRHRDRWNGASIVELGSGTGMAGLVAWLLGARLSILTDLEEVVKEITAPVAEENCYNADKRRKAALVVQPLHWGSAEHAQQAMARLRAATPLNAGKKEAEKDTVLRFDFVIAADVVYRSEDHLPLLSTICHLAGRELPTELAEGTYVDEEATEAEEGAEKEEKWGAPVTEAIAKEYKGPRFIFVHRRRMENDTNFVDPLKRLFPVLTATPVSEVFPAYPRNNLTIYEFALGQLPQQS
jgi:predicted nicotinamide N-methyase